MLTHDREVAMREHAKCMAPLDTPCFTGNQVLELFHEIDYLRDSFLDQNLGYEYQIKNLRAALKYIDDGLIFKDSSNMAIRLLSVEVIKTRIKEALGPEVQE